MSSKSKPQNRPKYGFNIWAFAGGCFLVLCSILPIAILFTSQKQMGYVLAGFPALLAVLFLVSAFFVGSKRDHEYQQDLP
ncbi:hypothetical protein BSR29_07635 [Boudabousia liubingyangii]|uniref:Uncharacterized protein n=1 Tax=Boudabousia liubingyangii TaxID=1921764 RepID=A0A1Q5PJN2_9ACTO|nr:hypothetical protein [Boudabousia liubingyangii]OKL46119.1 hypothetical protein BSR29_07635 [Boudabousia liubingyangii]